MEKDVTTLSLEMKSPTDFRQKGYGKAIVKFTLDFAWSSGCTEVMLLSGTHNKNAHSMYEKIGFDKHRKTGFIMYKPSEYS